jgi:transaldolase
MGSKNLKTKIFLDSGDPAETREIISMLGFLDGQTTNPTLISRNPYAKERFERGEKFTEEEIYNFYKQVVKEISGLIHEGSVSIETYADQSTTAEEMFEQGKEMFSWIPNAHIKYPITKEGLQAAVQSIKAGMHINMTLCFQQEQAAAVYSATKGAQKGQVFVSPFVGRLDDQGNNGMDIIRNIIAMYGSGDNHIKVLAASLRNIDHLLYSLQLGADIVTAPYKVLKEWARKDLSVPQEDYQYNQRNLKGIPYKNITLEKHWQEYDISHELTTKGIERFSTDWKKLIISA